MNAKRIWSFLPLLATFCMLLFGSAAAFGQPESTAEVTSEVTGSVGWIWVIWLIAPVGAIVALVFAWRFYHDMLESDEGDEDMIRISGYVRQGAMAYLRRQYVVVACFFVLVSLALFYMGWMLHVQHQIVFAAFLTGGFWSALCGLLGMMTATRASHRTTAGARKSLNEGLVVAFRSGAVMGLVVVGFGLIDITGWFILLHTEAIPWLVSTFTPWEAAFLRDMTLNEITVVMLTFGMGASSQALFARVGGGIFTKAADVGADLVGKVEAGIPEDDPRNPATIADNVGDNVGDVAGMGADLFESYCGSILATAALGVAAASALYGGEIAGYTAAFKMLSAPMVLAGVGILLSIVGIYMVRTQEDATMGQLLKALRISIWGSSVLIAVGALGVCYVLLHDIEGVSWLGVWGAIIAGLLAGNIIGLATEYYTSYEFSPTKKISEQALTGPATLIIAGVATGMKSTWASLATIIVAIMVAFIAAGGKEEFLLGLYGVGIAAVGMLATLGITLATDAYGPIADNAGGNAEMTGQDPVVRKRTDALDSLGNTTAATGKGFAIGSAALTALALLAAYVEEVRIGQIREARDRIAEVITEPNADEVIYLGHRKFGMRVAEGTGDGAFECLMVLQPKPVPDSLEPGTRITGLSTPDEEDVQSATIGSDVLWVVSARRASLAQYMSFYDVTLMNPKTLCGIFCGVLLVFLFCSLTMQAVGRAANRMMLECRNQFDKMRAYLRDQGKDEAFVNNSDNWPRVQIDYQGRKVPDYAKCVAISTAGAQRAMFFPSVLAVLTPVVVGLIFDVPGVMGLLAGGLTSGFAVAIFMANAGGAWDNAKKWIEVGHHGGKGSDAHKAGVVGDTVGDPFKDTSGPSLNILIKLMSMVSIVFAGLIVKYAPQIGAFLGIG